MIFMFISKIPLNIYDVLLADWRKYSLSCPQSTKCLRSILSSTSCVQFSKEFQMHKISSLELIVQARKVGWKQDQKLVEWERTREMYSPVSPSYRWTTKRGAQIQFKCRLLVALGITANGINRTSLIVSMEICTSTESSFTSQLVLVFLLNHNQLKLTDIKLSL